MRILEQEIGKSGPHHWRDDHLGDALADRDGEWSLAPFPA